MCWCAQCFLYIGGAVNTDTQAHVQVGFTMDAEVQGGTGGFAGAQGALSYSGRGATDFSDFIAYITVISNQGAVRRR